MLHLLRFHCISGELKVVEGSDFRDTCDYYWHGNWQAPTGSGLYHHNGTTHSLLTTMAGVDLSKISGNPDGLPR